jgi:hypothetical protein
MTGAAATVVQTDTGPHGEPSRLARRRWPLAVAALFVLVGCGYSLFWSTVMGGPHHWVQPFDIWVTFDIARYIGWGDIGDVYSSANGFITTPGIALVLTPAAMVISHFGLAGSYPILNPHPAGWLILGPVSIALCTPVLFAADAVAEAFGVDPRRRQLLCVAEAVALWQVASWGHPEDAIALTFALYALLDATNGRLVRSAWLLGLAVVFQPATLLLAVLGLAMAPDRRRLLLMAVRVAVPSLLLLVIPFAQSPHATVYALVDQPTYPALLHPTPWLPLAPVLQHLSGSSGEQFVLTHVGHATRFVEVATGPAGGNVVAPGTGRLIAVLLALGLAVWAHRRRPSGRQMVWLATLVLFGWVFSEPVMAPYYVWPALALVLVCASWSSWPRVALAIAGGTLAAAWSSSHLGPWAYWAPLVFGLGVAVLAVRPMDRSAVVGVTEAEEVNPSEQAGPTSR